MHHISHAISLFCRECAQLSLFISKTSLDFWYLELVYHANFGLQAVKPFPQLIDHSKLFTAAKAHHAKI